MPASVEVAVPFIVLKGLMFLYCSWELFVLVRDRHRVRSFKGIFLGLTVLWSLLRVIFWSLALGPTGGAGVGGEIILLLPFAIQFALFGLLAIFFAKLIWGLEAWRAAQWYRTLMRGVVVLCTVAVVVIEVTQAVLSNSPHQSPATLQGWQDVYFAVSALIFLALAVTFMFQAWYLSRMSTEEARRLGIFQPRSLVVTCSCLVVIFVTRVAWDIAAAAGRSFASVALDAHSPSKVARLLVAYIWWEDVPVWILIFVIAGAKVGDGERRSGWACCRAREGQEEANTGGWIIGYGEEMDKGEWGGGFGVFDAINSGGVVEGHVGEDADDSRRALLGESGSGSQPRDIQTASHGRSSLVSSVTHSSHALTRGVGGSTPIPGEQGNAEHHHTHPMDDADGLLDPESGDRVGDLPMASSGGVGSPGMVPGGFYGVASSAGGVSLPPVSRGPPSFRGPPSTH